MWNRIYVSSGRVLRRELVKALQPAVLTRPLCNRVLPFWAPAEACVTIGSVEATDEPTLLPRFVTGRPLRM